MSQCKPIIVLIFYHAIPNCFQGDYVWQDGSVLSFQDWFYPHYHINYARRWGYHPRKSISSEMALHHRYFQPQIRSGFNCSAMVMTGHISLSHRKWVTINCATVYRDVTFMCEKPYIRPKAHPLYVEQTAYNALLYSQIVNNTLQVPEEHCEAGWLHIHDGICASFYLSTVNDKHGCEHLNNDQVHAFLSEPSKTVANILQQFMEMQSHGRGSNVHLVKCTEPLIFRTLMLDAFFQCSDCTLIIEHHLCDGEADCPDASDESNCSWICQFIVSNDTHFYDCFSNCSKPNCLCHQLYFNCDIGGCVPLSKFCNGINDCPDSSDESLCPQEALIDTYIENPMLFLCHSGDQISIERVNDTVPDCPFHGDDETWLSSSNIININHTVPLFLPCIHGHPKVYIHYHACLLTWQQPGELATCRNGGHLRNCTYHSCPDHYKCEYSYCIPLHAVCDGVGDCPDGEDEKNCEALSCPNILHCKRDNLCIHRNYINDGLIDCPSNRDDEVTALQIQCPQYCGCIGYAAFCTNDGVVKFIGNLNVLRMLVWHNLSYQVFAKYLFHITFNSLKVLDLSNSHVGENFSVILGDRNSMIRLILNNISLSEIRPNTFNGFYNLRDLQLQQNPVHRIHTDGFNGLSALTVLDLSNLNIKTIMHCSFRGLEHLLHLNISCNGIEQLNDGILCGLESLQVLDIQNNNIIFVDGNVFHTTAQLIALTSSVRGLCCYVHIKHCSPEFDDEFASCTSILHHKIQHICCWIYSNSNEWVCILHH